MATITMTKVVTVCDRCGSQHDMANYTSGSSWGQCTVSWAGDKGGRSVQGDIGGINLKGEMWLCETCTEAFLQFTHRTKTNAATKTPSSQAMANLEEIAAQFEEQMRVKLPAFPLNRVPHREGEIEYQSAGTQHRWGGFLDALSLIGKTKAGNLPNEAQIHQRLTGFLSKADQGRVMGVLREEFGRNTDPIV
jgi:hypothetical protein